MKKPLQLLLLSLLPALPLHAAGIPVAGRVLAPDGKPAAGVRALLLPTVSAFEQARLELAGKAGPEPAASAATGADGGFRLAAPEAGLWTVRLEGAGFLPLETALAPLTEEAEIPDARMVPDAGLRVRVADPRGEPAARAWVRVEGEGGERVEKPWRLPLRRVAFTAVDGTVSVPRARGEVLAVWAGAPDAVPVRQERVHDGAVSLRLAAGVAREIAVRDPRGRPAVGALAVFEESSWPAGRTAEPGRLTVTIPAAGADLVLRMADGRRLDERLRAAKPGDQEPALATLPASSPAGGRVVAEGGKPLPGALVWLAGDPGLQTRAGRDGSFRMAHLPPEDAVLAAAPGTFVETGTGAGGRIATLILRPRLRASGIVVDEAGGPVADASLRAVPVLSGSARSRVPRRWEAWKSAGGFARSGADGRFQIAGLAAGIAYDVSVRREGLAPAEVELLPRTAGAPAPPLRIVLHPGRAAFGKVIDAAQRPVAEAGVVLRRRHGTDLRSRLREARDPAKPAAAVTDAAGRFEIPALPPGTFDLAVRARGLAPLTVPGLAIPEGKGRTDLGTVQLAPAGAIHGVVVDARGEPIADAEVHAGGDERRGAGEEADGVFTTADGSFAFVDLAPGVRLDLVATHPGYGTGTAPGVAVPTREPIRIVLAPSARVSGRAADPQGKPVAGATVTLRGNSRSFSSSLRVSADGRHQATTDEEGAFSFADVAPGGFALRAEAPHRQPAELRGLEAKPGQDLAGLEIVLLPGAAVEGKVLSPEGEPVAEAFVTVAEGSRRGFSGSRAGTGSDGHYRIEGIPPGPHTLEVRAEGYKRAVRDLDLTDDTRGVDFRLERGQGEVSGRVADDAGAPVADASVVLFGADGGFSVAQDVESGADGAFRFQGVSDGTYRLRAAKSGYSPAHSAEVRVAGGPVGGVELRLTSAEGTVAGRLTGLEFSQLSRVSVWSDSGGAFGGVDADGTYKLLHVPPGEVRVSAAVEGSALRAAGTVTLEPGVPEARLDLAFGQGHELSGVVLRNGQPLPDAGVFLVQAGGSFRQRAATDHEGGFRFGGLDDGTYLLNVLTPNGAWHQETVEVSGDRTVRVELRTARISGRVIDAEDASPLAGAAVLLKRTDGGRPTFAADATTDARGAFQLSEVGAGSWELQAGREGYAPAGKTVQVEGEAPLDDLEIRLEPTEGATLEVRLATGQPPDRIRVATLDAAGNAGSAQYYPTGENGRTRVAGVPPGSWLLLVDAPQSAAAAVPVSVPGPAVPVLLPPSGAVRLRVPALEETPAPARAVLSGAGGLLRGFDFDGTVRTEWELAAGDRTLDRVPPGVWQVAVRAADGRSWSATATVTPGGVATVELK